MGFVAIGMAETRLVMADNGIVPVAQIECAVGTELHIDGPEFAARGTNQRRAVFETKAGPVIDDVHAPNGVVDVAAENQPALPIVGPVRVGNEIAAGTFAAVAARPNQRRRIVTAIWNE